MGHHQSKPEVAEDKWQWKGDWKGKGKGASWSSKKEEHWPEKPHGGQGHQKSNWNGDANQRDNWSAPRESRWRVAGENAGSQRNGSSKHPGGGWQSDSWSGGKDW